MINFYSKTTILKMTRKGGLKGLVTALTVCGVLSSQAQTPNNQRATSLDVIHVKGTRSDASGLGLYQDHSAASRLDLSLFEIPASTEVIDQTHIAIKGDFSGLSAVTRATGIASSASPGNGGTAVSARGFNGHSSVVYTYDGVRLYVGAGTVSFPADTWTVDRVEVLRGPGSVINGVGAVGATINYAPKKPNEETLEHQVMFTGGSNGLRRVAFGSGGPINSELSYRFDAVNHSTNGYVDRANEERNAVAGTFQYRVDNFLASFSIDYANTEAAPYWGTPLVNGDVPNSIRRNNYNIEDGIIEYYDVWPRLRLEWQITDEFRFRNDTFYMDVDRQWRNVESYDYNLVSGLVDRSFYLEILHDQEQLGNRSEILWDFNGEVFSNKLSFGIEVNQIDFTHTNNSPYGGITSVSLQNPRAGFWAEGVADETTRDYTTDTNQYAIFIDDQIRINDYWSVVLGLRYDEIDYTRDDFTRSNGQSTGRIKNTLSGNSWRIGGVYQPNNATSLYLQYSTAVDSIQSILTATNPTLDLAEGDQFEIGLKQSLLNGRLQHTLALYDIVKEDLLSDDPGGVQRQIGRQSSKGIEWDVYWLPLDYLSLDFNLALIRPEYERFVSGANNFSGNTPRNVPERTANLWVTWLIGDCFSLGFGARYVGDRYSDDANTSELPSYTVWDASAQWRLNESVDLILRGHNLSDTTNYVLAPYGNQWILGDGRSVELSAIFSF